MRDAGLSTDLDSSVPLGSLPSPWERHLLLASCDDMKLPARDPGTGTKVSSTLPKYESIAAWTWSCERGCPSGKTLWSWATTVEVSCTAVQKVSQWVTGLALFFSQLTSASESMLSPISCQGRWFSVVEKAHFFWWLAVTPTLSGRHLDAALPTNATELESTNRRSSS